MRIPFSTSTPLREVTLFSSMSRICEPVNLGKYDFTKAATPATVAEAIPSPVPFWYVSPI